MNKLLAMILCITLMLSLSGCVVSGDQSNTTGTESVPTSSITESVPTGTTEGTTNIYEGPMQAISMPLVTQEQFADGSDVVIYRNQFQNVSLLLEDEEPGQAIMLDLLNRLDALSGSTIDVSAAAKNDYRGQQYWYPYFTSVTYEPTRIDSTILSFIGTEQIFDGTPGSTTIHLSVNYDLSTGEEISLKTILLEDYSADTLCEMIIEGLASYDKDSFFSDYKLIIDDMFSTNTPVDTWFFTDTGLTFFFNPYEIAPQSLGTVYSEIPYETLLGLVKEEYFPEEQLQYKGTIKAEVINLSSGNALDSFSRFADVDMAETREQILLSVDGSVTNLRILVGSKNDDGTVFTKECTVFSCAGMGPNDAVILHLDPASAADQLALEYISDGQLVQMMLRLNSDGSLTLYQ